MNIDKKTSSPLIDSHPLYEESLDPIGLAVQLDLDGDVEATVNNIVSLDLELYEALSLIDSILMLNY